MIAGTGVGQCGTLRTTEAVILQGVASVIVQASWNAREFVSCALETYAIHNGSMMASGGVSPLFERDKQGTNASARRCERLLRSRLGPGKIAGEG